MNDPPICCIACGDPVTVKGNSPFCNPCATDHVAGLNAEADLSEAPE